MTVFVDTSALYALCDPDDRESANARGYVGDALGTEDHLTHRYVEVETISLVQARMGMGVVRKLVEDILPTIRVQVVDDDVHEAAMAGLLSSGARTISFVDRVSFDFMRRRGLTTAFAFDSDFGPAGFDTVP